MAVFDTPVTTNDASLDKVLRQKLPVILYLYDRPNKALEDALNRVARENAGEMLVARVDVGENPQAGARFPGLALPALVTLDEGEVESQASAIGPADVDAHADFLLGQGPQPLETSAQTRARASAGAAPVEVHDRNFGPDVLQSNLPVLVDFWAQWCGPCHMVAPVLERLAEKYAGRIKIAKLNVDQNPASARQYQAMSIPLLLAFRDGRPVGRLVGAHPQPNIERLIEEMLLD
jgi:thioredoxin